jgi:serine/threonine protein kinase
MQSIQAKLKRPEQVDEVEKELTLLAAKVAEHYRSQEAVPPAAEFVSPRRPPISLPPELNEIYSDASFIGSGGFARVFGARRRNDGKEVAVKVPIALDASTGKSFVREIASWQHLNHRNIVKLYDLNILPIPYLEMELCERSLDDLTKPLKVEQAASLMFQVAEGLKHAHSQGIIHRDLKPQNVLLQAEIPKISDWGLSKVAAESKSSGGRGFSPLYAAPEQIDPRKFGTTDQRTDIYQLGAIFYELVTAEQPSKGNDMTELMAQIVMAEPERPSRLNPEASEVEHLIMKCLQKEMKGRYQSVAEMQRDLAQYLNEKYKKSLRQSQGDMKRSGYYCAELFLLHLRVADLANALKYAQDLSHYAGEEKIKLELANLIGELEYRSKEGIGIPEELVERAATVVHQVKMGW